MRSLSAVAALCCCYGCCCCCCFFLFYSFLCFAVAVDNFVVINAIRMRNLWPHARKKQMKKKKQQQQKPKLTAASLWLRRCLFFSLSLSFFFLGSICIRNEHVKSISIFQMETAAATISNQTAQTAQARPFSRSDRGSGSSSSSISCARSDRGSGSGSRVTESAGLVRKRMRCALWTN